LRLLVATCLCLFIATVALAAQAGAPDDGLPRAEPPDWVERIDIPELPDALLDSAQRGTFALLVDSQVAWDGDTELTYFRLAQQVLDRAGLEAVAAVSDDFDPQSTKITLLRLDVIRDGQVISYRDKVGADIFRRETRLDAGIIDGTLTAQLQVPDLRVGDIVDYEFLRERNSYIPGADRSVSVGLEFSVPVALARHVALWPADWPFHAAPVPERIAYSETPQGNVVRHEWISQDNRPWRYEDMTPVEALPYAEVQYGAYANWSDLSAALTPFYEADYPLTEEWEGRIAQIAADNPAPDARTAAALRLVQDNIRYVGVEIGPGGIFARPPAPVIARGFGDCKDKALLLNVILDRLEVDAHVALADLDEGYALPRRLPSVSAFDHMILTARIGGQDYWMDPTASHEGGTLDLAVAPDYGFALPLDGADRKALVPIPATERMIWRTGTTEAYSFNLLGVFLEVTTVFEGRAANWNRLRWATEAPANLSHSYLDYYAGRYPGIRELRPASIEDDRETNRLTLSERYFLPVSEMIENGVREEFPFGAEDFGNAFPDRQIGKRTTPLTVGEPRVNVHRVTVKNAPIAFAPPDPVEIANDAFDYRYTGWSDDDGGMNLFWTFSTKDRVIPADKVKSVIRDAGDIADSVMFTWDLTDAPDQ